VTRYFYDTEFLEDGRTIELISIAFVADDGREYYAVVEDADWPRIRQDEWLMANVVPQLPSELGGDWKPKAQIAAEVRAFLLAAPQPELWAWYSAYDHVALAQLFGRMLDLPKGIPMFTHDVRSLVDWVGVKWRGSLPQQESGAHDALADARHVKVIFDYLQQGL
jgi:hypothetical protein